MLHMYTLNYGLGATSKPHRQLRGSFIQFRVVVIYNNRNWPELPVNWWLGFEVVSYLVSAKLLVHLMGHVRTCHTSHDHVLCEYPAHGWGWTCILSVWPHHHHHLSMPQTNIYGWRLISATCQLLRSLLILPLPWYSSALMHMKINMQHTM